MAELCLLGQNTNHSHFGSILTTGVPVYWHKNHWKTALEKHTKYYLSEGLEGEPANLMVGKYSRKQGAKEGKIKRSSFVMNSSERGLKSRLHHFHICVRILQTWWKENEEIRKRGIINILSDILVCSIAVQTRKNIQRYYTPNCARYV